MRLYRAEFLCVGAALVAARLRIGTSPAPTVMHVKIIQVESPDQIAQARALFREYEASLGINLCFQNFEKELAELPGAYAEPDGRLLLAHYNGELAGCVALRKIGAGTC